MRIRCPRVRCSGSGFGSGLNRRLWTGSGQTARASGQVSPSFVVRLFKCPVYCISSSVQWAWDGWTVAWQNVSLYAYVHAGEHCKERRGVECQRSGLRERDLGNVSNTRVDVNMVRPRAKELAGCKKCYRRRTPRVGQGSLGGGCCSVCDENPTTDYY